MVVGFPHEPDFALIETKNATGRSPLDETETTVYNNEAEWIMTVIRKADRTRRIVQS